MNVRNHRSVQNKLDLAALKDGTAQHIHVTSNPPAERPKAAMPAGKAGSATEDACYGALQEVTEGYETLHDIDGEEGVYALTGQVQAASADDPYHHWQTVQVAGERIAPATGLTATAASGDNARDYAVFGVIPMEPL